MGPVPLTFDVTDALSAEDTAGRRIEIAAWLFMPDDPAALGERPVVMTLLAGGSYDKRYFHFEVPGRSGYSAAEHLAALGNIVLVPDHLGIGGSTRLPDQKRATRAVVARANHAAVTQFAERLRRGELHDKLPAMPDFLNIGGGHSMGGMQTIMQQAHFATYDAIMVLGYTAVGVHRMVDGEHLPSDAIVPAELTVDYFLPDRAGLHESFHWDDVPADVIEADDGLAVETPTVIGFDSVKTGIIAGEAARIDVPIYFCVGERDVSPDPRAEPARFGACADFTLHILPRSGHCHNFADTRQLLWNRMHGWARGLVAGDPGTGPGSRADRRAGLASAPAEA